MVYIAFLAPNKTVTWGDLRRHRRGYGQATWNVASLGGSANSVPDVVNDGGRVSVSVRGGNRAARVKTFTRDVGWTDWIDHGGTIK
jgi:hypothetical protein